MSEEERVETLLATAGKNPGEAIASHGRSIVFLPAGAEPGRNVRVRLVPIEGRTDSRGRTMFRGTPAPVEYAERWKDNGDGTATKVTIAANWLGETSEEGVVETRALQTRVARSRTTPRFSVVWGPSLADSYVEKAEAKVTQNEREAVVDGSLVWGRTGQREEIGQAERLPIEGIDVQTWKGGTWSDAVYSPAMTVIMIVRHGGGRSISANTTAWGELPACVRAEFEANHPLCPCGRQRRDAQVTDSYTKCELCRAEETCERCGKRAKVAVANGRLVCDGCNPYEEQEGIALTLAADHKSAIAAEARRLRAGNALAQAEGEAVLRATADHIALEWGRNDILRRWSGYGWYYFSEDGVYGSKFSPAALAILELLPVSSGNGLVEMAAWLVDKKPSGSDFYLRTQVNGEAGVQPAVTEDLLKQVAAKLEAGQLVLACRLRGSEADRIAALAGYRNLVEKLGEESREAKAVAEILQGERQNYAAALAEIRKADDLFAAAERGEVMLNFGGHFRHMGENDQCDAWVVSPDGQEVESEVNYRKRYASEGDKRWPVVGPEDLALRWSRVQSGGQFHESWEVVKLPAGELGELTEAQIAAARQIEPHERFSGSGSGFDLSRVGVNACSASRDSDYSQFWVPSHGSEPVPCDESGQPINPEALRLKQLQEAAENYDKWFQYALQQVAEGNWTRLKFRRGVHPKTGTVQWEAGNRHQKLVLDRFGWREPVEGEEYFCSFGKVLVETPTFRLQVVRLEPPFPEDAPKAESGGQVADVTPDLIEKLKANWGTGTK